MKWGYEGVVQGGAVKICPCDCINLDKPLFEVATLDDAAIACKEHNETEERAAEAKKLLKKAHFYLDDFYDDEKRIRIEIKKFLGGGEG
jgi:hypothetical protein